MSWLLYGKRTKLGNACEVLTVLAEEGIKAGLEGHRKEHKNDTVIHSNQVDCVM
jgi:hypothetical protein